MKVVKNISISQHIILPSPAPHVRYEIHVELQTGRQFVLYRRYSDFFDLHKQLRDAYTFPSKHVIAHLLVPGTSFSQELIKERKAALRHYLDLLNNDTQFQQHPAFLGFLNADVNFSFDGRAMRDLGAPASALRASNNQQVTVVDGEETRPIAAAYYPSWAFRDHPPEKLTFSRFDILFFAFVTPNASSSLDWEPGSQELLQRLVSSAQNQRAATKIVLSIGGWAGCQWFSDVMHTSASRVKLSNAIISAIYRFGLDGVDLDWEYPNSAGAGNPHRVNDSMNFLKFIQLLRATLGTRKIISAAVPHLPWLGPSGQPMRDVRDFVKEMTYVNIMNYDVFGASKNPGPNAPLGNLCGTSKHPEASAHAAVAQWKDAGFPPSKILLGLPLYGYVSKSTAKKLSGSLFPNADGELVSHPRAPQKTLPTTAPHGDLSSMWGQQISFSQLIKAGVIAKRADGTYGAANGYTMGWDDCSDTPYLFNVNRSTIVTYDDTWSIESKCKFARDAGLGGCFTWSLDQDDNYALHDVLCRTLGRK